MSVNLTHDIKRQKTYVISLVEGDVVEIRVNDNPLISATVAVGTQGTVRIEYKEIVII